MAKRRFVLACVVGLVAAMGASAQGEFFFYGLQGEHISVTPVDSIIVVSFKSGALTVGTTPSQFAATVAGLSGDYPFWQWTDGFWVVGIDSGVSVDSVFARIKARTEVGTVNPVVLIKPGMLGWMTDGFIVRFLASLSRAQIDAFNAAQGVSIGYVVPGLVNEFVLQMPGDRGRDLLGICRTYYESGLCVFAQPNFVYQGGQNSYPNDPKYVHQWHFRNDGTSGGTSGVADADIDADSAWMVTTGDHAVIIAILDSGLDFNHEDLAGADTFRCYDAAQFVPKSQSTPPVTDFNPTFDCGASFNGWTDICPHGTAVTGEIFARTNNTLGVAGLAPNCRLMVIKIWDGANNTRSDVLADAIRHTYRDPSASAHIASNSWGGPPSPVITDALDSAYAYGVTFVFSAGTVDINGLTTVHFPGRLPTVIAVGATNPWDIVYGWSPHDTTLDIVAPGGGISSTDLTGGIGYNPWEDPCDGNQNYTCSFTGTSAAAPLVAGTLGLVLSRRPDLIGNIPAQRAILYGSAEDKGTPGYDTYYGYGRVNAYEAMLSIIRGDVDNSGQIDTLDARAMERYCFRVGPPPTLDRRVGDTDCDGDADIFDFLKTVDAALVGTSIPPCFSY